MRRFVLLDFLLIVLREAGIGSSDMCGYRGRGEEWSQCTHGGKSQSTPISRPALVPSTPDGGSFRRLQPLLCRGLPPVPGIASARTAAVFRPALTAHLPLSSLLPVAIQLQLGVGTRPPTAGSRAGPLGTQRWLGRERGALAEQGHSRCQGGHADMRQAHRHAPFCNLCPHLTQEGPWCGMECPTPVRLGQGRAPPRALH